MQRHKRRDTLFWFILDIACSLPWHHVVAVEVNDVKVITVEIASGTHQCYKIDMFLHNKLLHYIASGKSCRHWPSSIPDYSVARIEVTFSTRQGPQSLHCKVCRVPRREGALPRCAVLVQWPRSVSTMSVRTRVDGTSMLWHVCNFGNTNSVCCYIILNSDSRRENLSSRCARTHALQKAA